MEGTFKDYTVSNLDLKGLKNSEASYFNKTLLIQVSPKKDRSRQQCLNNQQSSVEVTKYAHQIREINFEKEEKSNENIVDYYFNSKAKDFLQFTGSMVVNDQT